MVSISLDRCRGGNRRPTSGQRAAVARSTDSYRDNGLLGGALVFDRAAHSEIGSSEHVFEQLTLLLLDALLLDNVTEAALSEISLRRVFR
jgi:hypothetical protein